MKRLLTFSALAITLLWGACNSEKAQRKATQDSLAEASAADSMLKEALKEDSIKSGAKQADSLHSDSIK